MIARRLARRVDALRFGAPVTHVYNPLAYAGAVATWYLDTFARSGTPTLLVGMNPGPFGMAQTGIPFGAVPLVRDFIGVPTEIARRVGRPPTEHPKRPIRGFACPRTEVSGERLWGWARDRFGSAPAFFADYFVWNYCPLAFMEESGRNRTPDKLPAPEREALYAPCDDALRAFVAWMQPKRVVGVGAFASARARAALDETIEIATVLHPSPASPAANRGWARQAEEQLAQIAGA